MNARNSHNGNSEHRYTDCRPCRKTKYRVKSKFRFITSLVIVFALLFSVGSFVFGNYESIALTKHETITEYVDNGETLWTIAKKHKSHNTDTREAVYKICRANDISADDLQPGMVLTIPDSI